MTKQSGILLHISSLPSPYGIGSFGKEAYEFVDFLSRSGQKYWQVLPLCQTSYGDSPYQSPSAFAGNPYFIDLRLLKNDGLLTDEELQSSQCDDDFIDYGKLYAERYALLRLAHKRFVENSEFNNWTESVEWLEGYALFMALKTKFGGISWQDWPEEYRYYNALTVEIKKEFSAEVAFWRFLQYEFYKQFFALKSYAADKKIQLIGDLPIYVALDSADVWCSPELFLLDKNLRPTEVAGVPPDLFAENGQLWGNPLYDWEYHKSTGYEWWHRRLLYTLQTVDIVRIDHFRGFKSYYKIPYGAADAKNGVWAKGPELDVFKGIKDFTEGRVIAEDLGIITDDVRDMLTASGFPGMKVLQFAFATNTFNEYLPHNFISDNYVVYTGTHDNDTTNGWFKSLSKKERDLFCKLTGYFDEENPLMKYILGKNAKAKSPARALIEMAMKSKAKLAIVPMQDYLELGTEARMNLPSKNGYWRWRLKGGELSLELSQRIKSASELREYCNC